RSVLRSTMNQEMRTSMDSSQISVQDLTEEQFRQISQYDKIKEMGYTIFLSVAENEELQTISTEIRYADENGARSYQCLPTQGTLPQGEKEAAVSTRSEEHTSELQSRFDLVCRLLLETK